MTEYAPFIDKIPQVKKVKNAIYAIRSKLVHGESLLSQDIEPWNNIVNPKEKDESDTKTLLFDITVTALRHWFWEQKAKISE